jgi:hypothetical protein
MDDIIHSAPQRPWVISLIVLAALFVALCLLPSFRSVHG